MRHPNVRTVARDRPPAERPPTRWGLRAYLALMLFAGLGSLHRGRFDGLALLVLIGCGAGVVVLVVLAAHEDPDQ